MKMGFNDEYLQEEHRTYENPSSPRFHHLEEKPPTKPPSDILTEHDTEIGAAARTTTLYKKTDEEDFHGKEPEEARY